MGATPADTQRQIAQLRDDMTAALAEIERRVRGGLRGVAKVESRLGAAATGEDVAERARENPTLLGVAGVCIIGHGSSNARAMVNAIRVAQEMVDQGLVTSLRAAVGVG